jgi:hypothetical protein
MLNFCCSFGVFPVPKWERYSALQAERIPDFIDPHFGVGDPFRDPRVALGPNPAQEKILKPRGRST